MLPDERPCITCMHKKVCEASKKFDEIDVTITHPFFKAKIVCSEYSPKSMVREGLNKAILEGKP